jgi:hypothetical protein
MADKSRSKAGAYSRIIEEIFNRHYRKGAKKVAFGREDIRTAAKEQGIDLPSNIGDVVYSFRYRAELPRSIRDKAPESMQWVIRPVGAAKYSFELTRVANITPAPMLAETKIPNATPGLIDTYALTDEQALLAKLRYNRLIDVFTGLTCYSLQSHLRTQVPNMGQVETDELYVGLDKRGSHYIIPVQAKGGNDKLGVVQIEQDVAMCAAKFHHLICKPIGAQFMDDDLIALFEFELSRKGVAIASEKHYRLVPPEEVSAEDLATYKTRTDK